MSGGKNKQGELRNVDERKQAQVIGSIQAEVHTLNTLVKTLFKKFDEYVERNQPKQMAVTGYIGIAVSIMGIFALLFGSVIYITNSSNAPIIAQTAQMLQTMNLIQGNTVQNASQSQLANLKMSAIKNKTMSNDDTLRWLLFDENIPKKVTVCEQRINVLENEVERLRQAYYKEKE